MASNDDKRRAAIMARAGELMALRDRIGSAAAIDGAITHIVAGAVVLEREIGPTRAVEVLLSTAGRVHRV